MKSFFKNTKIFLVVVILVVTYLGIFSSPQKAIADDCTVTSAAFRVSPGLHYPAQDFIAPGNNPYIYVDVKTTGCVVGTTIVVSVNYAAHTTFGSDYWDDLSGASNISVTIADGLEDFTLEFVAGYEGCVWRFPDWDCQYRIATWTEPLVANPNNLPNTDLPSGHSWDDVVSDDAPNRRLAYECELELQANLEQCSQSPAWQHIPQVFPFGTVSGFDSYNSSGVNNLTPETPDDSYLAPLPGVTVGAGATLGTYLQAIFLVLIIIAGVLAFIMVVIGAVTYLSSDAFSGKSEGKEMMLNAIFGLILALGAWIILNTINPNLASNLEITIPDVSLDGATPEWKNGNAAPGDNIAIGRTINGGPILMGQPWPPDATQRQVLSQGGVTVSSTSGASCSTAGQAGCTSVYFEGDAAGIIQQIVQFRTICGGCEIVITGGSEAWLHSTHGPNIKKVDMRITTSLNQYLNGLPGGPDPGTGFPTNKTISVPGVGSFKAEAFQATDNTTAEHWHVTFY